LIHGSSEWGCVSGVYSSGVSPKGPALVRFHVIKKYEKSFLYVCSSVL